MERCEALIEEIKRCIRVGVLSNKFYPVLCGTGLGNIGISFLLDAVIDYLPTPNNNEFIKAYDMNNNEVNIKVSDNEMLLACYGPIVEGAVDRLVLNKQQGTLFVWYSSSSRQRKARNVYLIRRLGMNSKPEWRWN